MDSKHWIDIEKDPITEEIIFEFKEMIQEKEHTQSVQRIPTRIIANWQKLMYHELDSRIFNDECNCEECRNERD